MLEHHHYMTDKYNYEAVQMAFLPTKQRANMGFGICGFANTVDTLSAIKYATVKPIRDENGYIYDYETIGEYPRWGEDDPRSNELAEWLIEAYTTRLRSHKLYKDAEATVSLLTSHLTLLTLNKLVTHQYTKVYTSTKMVL